MADPADIQLNLNNDQAGQVVQQNVPAGAQTTLTFKVEQSKVLDYWGQKAKDTVTANIFIRKIDDLARTNNWNDNTAYANVANMLKGFAWDWLFSTVEMLDWSVDQLTWTNLKPRFQKQFATQTDDKLIIDGLSNLAMSLNETIGELLVRITNTMVIIKESYTAYENKVEAPPQDGNRGYLDATATKWKSVNNVMPFFKIQLFRAALPGDIHKVVAQHNQNTITLEDMYQVATDTQREAGSKTTLTVAAVYEDSNSDAEDDEDEIAAFQNKRSTRFQSKLRKSNSMAQQCNNRYTSGAGSNSNQNCKYCFYCKIQNHTQEECWKRIWENKPCKDKQGLAYWPKVYVTSNSNSEQNERDQQGQQQGFC
jgi:hypothetical protein